MRSTYRALGKRKSNRPLAPKYTRWVWEQAAAENCLEAGKCVLELGTGWTHANSLYIGLVGNCSIMTFDVVDSRSLASLKYQVPLVLKMIEGKPGPFGRRETHRAQEGNRNPPSPRLRAAYEILRITYQVNPTGVPLFSDETFDLIYSMDVLEHVRREDFSSLVRRWRDMLKPGARFVAQVGLDDHLRHYDSSKSLKEYLRHSDFLWRRLLQNDLQYINRLTATEILDAFRDGGLDVEGHERELCDISGLSVHPFYRKQSQEDLATVRLIFGARRRA